MPDVPFGRIFLAVFLNFRETSAPFRLIVLVHDSGDYLESALPEYAVAFVIRTVVPTTPPGFVPAFGAS